MTPESQLKRERDEAQRYAETMSPVANRELLRVIVALIVGMVFGMVSGFSLASMVR